MKRLLADSDNDKSLALNILSIPVQNCQTTTADDEGFDFADKKKLVTASALLFFFLFFSAFQRVASEIFLFFFPACT